MQKPHRVPASTRGPACTLPPTCSCCSWASPGSSVPSMGTPPGQPASGQPSWLQQRDEGGGISGTAAQRDRRASHPCCKSTQEPSSAITEETHSLMTLLSWSHSTPPHEQGRRQLVAGHSLQPASCRAACTAAKLVMRDLNASSMSAGGRSNWYLGRRVEVEAEAAAAAGARAAGARAPPRRGAGCPVPPAPSAARCPGPTSLPRIGRRSCSCECHRQGHDHSPSLPHASSSCCTAAAKRGHEAPPLRRHSTKPAPNTAQRQPTLRRIVTQAQSCKPHMPAHDRQQGGSARQRAARNRQGCHVACILLYYRPKEPCFIYAACGVCGGGDAIV